MPEIVDIIMFYFFILSAAYIMINPCIKHETCMKGIRGILMRACILYWGVCILIKI